MCAHNCLGGWVCAHIFEKKPSLKGFPPLHLCDDKYAPEHVAGEYSAFVMMQIAFLFSYLFVEPLLCIKIVNFRLRAFPNLGFMSQNPCDQRLMLRQC